MKRRLPALKPREALRALERAGFAVHHVSGSHYVLKHPDRPGARVTLPYHSRDLKRRTLASIVDQAGLTEEEFTRFL
jgi:predicted RNA binding protein YcfA (HicA-like mRNA interferase family)